MTSFFGAVLLVGGVIALSRVFGLFPRVLLAVRTSKKAVDVMHDRSLGDDRKESLLQGYSLSLLRSFLALLIRGGGSVAIPIGLLWAFEVAGILSIKAVVDLTLSWPFLLGSVIAGVAVFWLLEN